jgi:MFS transporter, DHA1 family, multidrug resistance protein
MLKTWRVALGLPDDPKQARGTLVLLIDNLLMWCGFFTVIPLVSVHFVKELGWAASLIGIVFALRQLVQQGVTVFSGALADRIGTKQLILMGLLIRALGFMSMAWAETFPILLASALLAGLGGALFESPKSAAMAALSDEANRRRIYAVQGVSNNLGMGLGVLMGGLLIRASFDVVAIASGVSYLAAFVVTLVLLPQVWVSSGERGMWAGLAMAARDRRYVTFILLSIGYYILWVQLSLGISLEAERLTGKSESVTWVFLTNTLVGIILQYPVIRFLEPRLKAMYGLVLGTLLMAIGLGLVTFVTEMWMLLGCVLLYALGSLILSPYQQTAMVELSNSSALGSYMGFGWLGLAFGGALGNYFAGALYDLGVWLKFEDLPWVIMFVIGVLTSVGLYWFARKYSGERKAE